MGGAGSTLNTGPAAKKVAKARSFDNAASEQDPVIFISLDDNAMLSFRLPEISVMDIMAVSILLLGEQDTHVQENETRAPVKTT